MRVVWSRRMARRLVVDITVGLSRSCTVAILHCVDRGPCKACVYSPAQAWLSEFVAPGVAPRYVARHCSARTLPKGERQSACAFVAPWLLSHLDLRRPSRCACCSVVSARAVQLVACGKRAGGVAD